MKLIGNNNNVSVCLKEIVVDNKHYQLPKGFNFNNLTIRDGEITAKGYTLQGNKFVKNEPKWKIKLKLFFKRK
jgi:hypothetical protein